MSQKLLILGIVVVVALGAGVFALINNSNQIPTVNLTATANNSTSGISSANSASSSSNQKTNTSTNSAKTSTSSSNSSGSGGSTGSTSDSSGSSSSSDGGWTTVVPSSTNTHSETTG